MVVVDHNLIFLESQLIRRENNLKITFDEHVVIETKSQVIRYIQKVQMFRFQALMVIVPLNNKFYFFVLTK